MSRAFVRCERCRRPTKVLCDDPYCISCDAVLDRTKRNLIDGARRRSRERGLPFEITIDDIRVPPNCPALGIALLGGTGSSHDASPTLDRIIPERGYVKGNIIVVSNLANRIKNSATQEQLRRVAGFYECITP